MNQILFNKIENNKKTKIFKMQFIISSILTIIIIIILCITNKEEFVLENLSKILNKNMKLYDIYSVEKIFKEEVDTSSIISVREINPNITKEDIIKAFVE